MFRVMIVVVSRKGRERSPLVKIKKSIKKTINEGTNICCTYMNKVVKILKLKIG